MPAARLDFESMARKRVPPDSLAEIAHHPHLPYACRDPVEITIGERLVALGLSPSANRAYPVRFRKRAKRWGGQRVHPAL